MTERQTAMSRISSLTTQYPVSLIGVDADPVRLTWQIEAAPGSQQSEAQIEASATSNFAGNITTAHVTGEDQISIAAPGGEFTSREVRHYRVR